MRPKIVATNQERIVCNKRANRASPANMMIKNLPRFEIEKCTQMFGGIVAENRLEIAAEMATDDVTMGP